MSIQIIRALEKEAATGSWSSFRLIAPQGVALHLLNTKRDTLRGIEERHSVAIQVLISAELAMSEFNLEKMRRPQNQAADQRKGNKGAAPRPAVEVVDMPPPETEENVSLPEEESAAETTPPPREGNRGGRGGVRRGRRGGRGRRGSRGRDNKPFADSLPPAEDSGNVVPIESAASQPADFSPAPENDYTDVKRGRRRWRDERPDRPRRSNAPVETSQPMLPAFAMQDPIPVEPPPPKIAAAAIPESTPRDPNAPPKKGWWKKIIELDE